MNTKPNLSTFATIDPRKLKAPRKPRKSRRQFIITLKGRKHGRINLSNAFFHKFNGLQYYSIAINLTGDSIAVIPSSKDDPKAIRFSINSRRNGYNNAYNSRLVEYIDTRTTFIDIYRSRYVKVYANPANVSDDYVIFHLTEDNTGPKDRIVEKPREPFNRRDLLAVSNANERN